MTVIVSFIDHTYDSFVLIELKLPFVEEYFESLGFNFIGLDLFLQIISLQILDIRQYSFFSLSNLHFDLLIPLLHTLYELLVVLPFNRLSLTVSIKNEYDPD